MYTFCQTSSFVVIYICERDSPYLRKLAIKKVERKEKAAERRKNKHTTNAIECSGAPVKGRVAATAASVISTGSRRKVTAGTSCIKKAEKW